MELCQVRCDELCQVRCDELGQMRGEESGQAKCDELGQVRCDDLDQVRCDELGQVRFDELGHVMNCVMVRLSCKAELSMWGTSWTFSVRIDVVLIFVLTGSSCMCINKIKVTKI